MPVSCNPHLDIGSAYTLLVELASRVATTPNLQACTLADGSCKNLDTSEGFIEPVNSHIYDICGNGESSTGNKCFGASTILVAAAALQVKCGDAVTVGGSVGIAEGIALQL
jgi:hypothetical protein